MIRESELEEMEKKWRAENERIMREHPNIRRGEMARAGRGPARAAEKIPRPARSSPGSEARRHAAPPRPESARLRARAEAPPGAEIFFGGAGSSATGSGHFSSPAVGGMLAHDPLVLGLPLLLHVGELGFADHIVDAGAEMAGHAARAADPLADRAHHARQILGPDHHQGDQRR